MNTVRDFVSGFSGGFLSTAILHPFDLVRNRQAVNDGDPKRPKYGNQMSIVRSVVKNEGARSLWRGVSPSIIGAGLSWDFTFQYTNISNGSSMRTMATLFHNISISSLAA